MAAPIVAALAFTAAEVIAVNTVRRIAISQAVRLGARAGASVGFRLASKKVASGPMAGRVLRRGSVRTATGMVIYRTAKAAPYYKQSRTFRRYSKYKTAKRTVKTYKRRRADLRRKEFSKRYRAVSPSGYVYYYYRKRRRKS